MTSPNDNQDRSAVTLACLQMERDCRKFGGASGGGVFWRLFFDLRWTRGLDCEVGENRGRW
jgi:hypothetical protein